MDDNQNKDLERLEKHINNNAIIGLISEFGIGGALIIFITILGAAIAAEYIFENFLK